jgi:hypothetical protein
MTKNPFELRADVLAMAKDYLDEQYKINSNAAQQLHEVGQKTAAELQAAMEPYSVQTLTETAKDMYSFVSKKD